MGDSLAQHKDSNLGLAKSLLKKEEILTTYPGSDDREHMNRPVLHILDGIRLFV